MSQPGACTLSRRAGHAIAIARDERGWSQAVLAARLDVSKASVAMFESGRRNLTLPLLEAVSGVLGCEPGELLEVRSAATREAGPG